MKNGNTGHGINFSGDVIAIDFISSQQKETILIIAIAIRLQNGNQSCDATATNATTKRSLLMFIFIT